MASRSGFRSRLLSSPERDAMDAFGLAQAVHHFLHFRIGAHTNAVLHAVDQARSRQHFVAAVDADQEFRRADIALDRTELDAFDFARYRPKLARRVDLAFDSAT